ncbi:rhodanese-like domain-containing protein [Hymenobacter rigui]|uniref:Rhodanese-like domain-containing protein n=1 Tax=Hymenobacter rigui TaxID=334424 RepID=A0A428KC51_9BACT|nr:rhodanese-like domain-containing protein [Hymenobacter rigui]RSK43998.1 rhodanese-like domain-containing protein [Hymenobacter rigui]
MRILCLTALLVSISAATYAQSSLPVTNAQPKIPTPTVAAPSVTKIPPQEAKALLQQPNTILLDVRTPEEYAAGHLAGAKNLDFKSPDFASQLTTLDPNNVYVLYCRSGNRSNQAGLVMQDKGFKKVLNAGAYEELNKQGVKK